MEMIEIGMHLFWPVMDISALTLSMIRLILLITTGNYICTGRMVVHTMMGDPNIGPFQAKVHSQLVTLVCQLAPTSYESLHILLPVGLVAHIVLLSTIMRVILGKKN